MTTNLKPSSAFATLFRPWFGLVDHWIAWRRSDTGAFLPSRRFSAWFGRLSRGTQLWHDFGDRPAHLLRTGGTLAGLPGTQLGLHLWTGQHQVIVHNGDDLVLARPQVQAELRPWETSQR